ncbi:MAG: ABC transporter substrate-binding protein [Brockia lithotrophica]|nr:ABC transporter substrate-binding protein [Brockia lithotrophica]
MPRPFALLRRRIALIPLVALVLLGSACAAGAPSDTAAPPAGSPFASSSEVSPPSGERTKIRLHEVTHSPFYAPQYVALALGYFADEGLDVELVDGKGGDKVTTALLSGNADVILVGAEMAVYVNAQTPQDPMVVFARLTKRDGSFLVSRTPIEPFRWEDLRGKKFLAQRKGGMPDMIARHVLRKHGLEPGRDLEFLQHVDYANLAPAFASGTGDVVQLFEPFASTLAREGKGYVVAGFGPESGDVLYTSYHARKSTLEARRDVLIRFARAVARGQAYVRTHGPEEVARVLRDAFPGVEEPTLAEIVRRLQEADVFGADPLPPREDYERTLDILAENGMLATRLPYEAVVDPSIAEAAMRSLR